MLSPSLLPLATHEIASSAVDNQVGIQVSLASLAGVCSRSGFAAVFS